LQRRGLRVTPPTAVETASVAALRGLRVVLVAPADPPFQTGVLATSLQLEGARVVRVAADPLVHAPLAKLSYVRQRLRIAKFRATLGVALAQGADVVHVEAVGGAEFQGVAGAALDVARAAGVRTVARCFGIVSAGSGEALTGADAVVAPSRHLRDELRERLGIRACVVPAIVEDSGLEPPPPRSAGRLRLVCARPLEPVNGVGLVLAAAATALADGVDLELVVAGDGSERAELVRIAARVLPGRVRFAGALRREALVALLRASDVLVDAGRSDEFPGVLADALAIGLPVATTAAPATAWMVDHGETALVTPAGDATALAGSIETFDGDRAALAGYGWRAKIGALRWTWDAVGASWAAVYAS
jgi:glycosyltransferase involved in cell wall biosynthesis